MHLMGEIPKEGLFEAEGSGKKKREA